MRVTGSMVCEGDRFQCGGDAAFFKIFVQSPVTSGMKSNPNNNRTL